MRNLLLVLGDQLDLQSAAFDGADPALDAVWMCEAVQESTRVWSHKARIAVFLSAMRHFHTSLCEAGFRVHYHALDRHPHDSIGAALAASLATLRPARVVMIEPGEWSIRADIERVCAEFGVALDIRIDRHFLCGTAEFSKWLARHRLPRMEFFYRDMRRRLQWLMEDGQPLGGQWNFDADNREPISAVEAQALPPPLHFAPDAITREVLTLVASRFAGHPGALEDFDWPLTRADALRALADFVDHRLPLFGRYQDAMSDRSAWLAHSRLSAALNLHLLAPREVCLAALAAFERGQVPLASVEGFIRQIIGWREYVRGIYWTQMPSYLQRNALDARQPLPAFFWNADTHMRCLRIALQDTLAHGYAHHIQRLMVTGLFALLLGVQPEEVHRWYLAIYVDAVEWAELPNVIGMSQHADGGFMASKPYIASGKYIQRMSNYCEGCRYRAEQASGAQACPFTTLYWAFLDRHQQRYEKHPRLALQVKQLRRKDSTELDAIRQRAETIRRNPEAL